MTERCLAIFCRADKSIVNEFIVDAVRLQRAG